MEDYLKQLNLKDGKGTWALLTFMFLIYLLTCYGPRGFKEACFLNEHIKNWQWWRIISPTVLHTEIGHLIDGACWLVFLGYQIEYFFGTSRFFSLILLLSIFSNGTQYYFHGGPFEGFSSISVGMGLFLWRRERSYKEAYYFPLLEKRILFIGVLIWLFLAICLDYQIFTFLTNPVTRFLDMLGSPHPNEICHTAHICAGILGWFLGGLSVFRHRMSINKASV